MPFVVTLGLKAKISVSRRMNMGILHISRSDRDKPEIVLDCKLTAV